MTQRIAYTADRTLPIELARRIHKGQFNLGRLRLKDRSTSAIWNAVLVA
jgi:transposase, IS6 family